MRAPDKPMNRKEYEKALRALQVELCSPQDWVKEHGQRVVVVFEGRDAAGKGGTIKAITDRVSPRVFRVVALPAPSDRDKSQLYMQRYLEHFPAAGEIVMFDRSWYNRAGVEYVMGFCSKAQHRRFLEVCPEFERYVVDDGILRGPHRGSAASVEAEPDGPLLAQQMVRILAGARYHARGHGHGVCSLVYRALG